VDPEKLLIQKDLTVSKLRLTYYEKKSKELEKLLEQKTAAHISEVEA
jgi:hypothetical protein